MCILLAVLLVVILLSNGMRDVLPPLFPKRSCGCASGVCGGTAGPGVVAARQSSATVNKKPESAPTPASDPTLTVPPVPAAMAAPFKAGTAGDSTPMTGDQRRAMVMNSARTSAISSYENDVNAYTKIGVRTGVQNAAMSYAGVHAAAQNPTSWINAPSSAAEGYNPGP